MALLLPIFLLLVASYILLIVGVRIGWLSAWKATLMIVLFSIGGGSYYGFSRGDGLVGAVCMSSLLVVPFGFITLVLSKWIERKKLQILDDDNNKGSGG